MKIPAWLIKPFTVMVERYYPDPFIFAVLMSLITFVAALLFTDATPNSALIAWGDGLPALLTFTAQMSITLLAAHALAHTDRVQKILRAIGSLPRNAASAYALVACSAGIGSLIAWALGLIAGATIARQVAIECSRRGIKVHYPLLVASAYAGFVVWHMGYSSSAGLFVATPGHTLESSIGIIPITDTIFSLSNGLVVLATLIAITIVCPMMRPDDKEIIEVDTNLLEDNNQEERVDKSANTLATKLDNLRLLSLIPGLTLLIYLASSMIEKGFFLTLDVVNWSFIGLGLLLARSPLHYVRLIEKASTTIGPIVLQYPFYAGVLGMMITTGLAGVISDWFVNIASDKTLGLAAFLAAGIVNIFVPSGGGQWAVQGPIFTEAAMQLNVDPSIIVLAVAYGDQWTNMIQPFWTIPLLAIAGLHLRQIMGYTVVILLVTGVIFAGGLLIMGAG